MPGATTEPATVQYDRWIQALTEGVDLFARLRSAWFRPEAAAMAETLLTLCHVLGFRLRTANELPLIGIVGNADSGKSTLLGSVAGAEISKVTPIPHQTTGPILAVPRDFQETASDPSFLRPVVEGVDPAPEGTTGLSGSPARAVAVPAWDRQERPFLLMDLPDIGTMDAKEEKQVALRILAWLDRVILLVTEETFAQEEHEEVTRVLRMLRPERARPDLFVVLNRRHTGTTDAEFSARIEKVRSLWPDATVSTLPHLSGQRRFPSECTTPLMAEAGPRATRTLQDALHKLAAEMVAEMRIVQRDRALEQRLLREAILREIESACRFSKSFFSDDFRRRLDVFSPWQVSMKRIRTLLKNDSRETTTVDLVAEAPVHRHVIGAAQRIRLRILRHLEGLAQNSGGPDPVCMPDLPEARIRAGVSALVAETNEHARRHVETLLESLQEGRKVRDPLWKIFAGASSSLLLLELVIPGFGTLSSMALSGLLSALGFGGIITADMMRKLRSTRVRESFEAGMRTMLDETVSCLLETKGPLSVHDLADLSRRLTRWAAALPEV